MDSLDQPHPPALTAYALERTEEACPYLPGRRSAFEHYLFMDCDADAFCLVLESGFRHFGHYFFRPACAGCGACVSVRVPVAEFAPSKSQRRVLRRGEAIQTAVGRPRYSDAKYELYLKHKARFRPLEGARESAAEAATSPEAFRASFYADFPFTWECTYTLGGRLLGVGLIDLAPRLASSIYFTFDPEFAEFSPGTLSILRELDLASSLGTPFYYLGYTVYGNPVMRYKLDYRPCEYHDGAHWRPLREGKDFLKDPAEIRTGPYEALFEPEP